MISLLRMTQIDENYEYTDRTFDYCHWQFRAEQLVCADKKVDGWSWESFWLVQGIFAWLVFPLLGALLAIPAGSSLLELWGAGGALPAMVYGVLWGVGGLTFGLSMRYLGVALGQSIALGTCAGFGTLFPRCLPEKICFMVKG